MWMNSTSFEANVEYIYVLHVMAAERALTHYQCMTEGLWVTNQDELDILCVSFDDSLAHIHDRNSQKRRR